jgi:hypothetical protein
MENLVAFEKIAKISVKPKEKFNLDDIPTKQLDTNFDVIDLAQLELE